MIKVVVRLVLVLAALGVVGVAFWVSYWHADTVLLWAGEAPLTAAMEAATPDALMAVAGCLMVLDRVQGRKVRPWTRFAMWYGVTVSLGVNMIAPNLETLPPVVRTVVLIMVAAWPPSCLFVAVEMLLHSEIKGAARRAPASKPRTVVDDQGVMLDLAAEAKREARRQRDRERRARQKAEREAAVEAPAGPAETAVVTPEWPNGHGPVRELTEMVQAH